MSPAFIASYLLLWLIVLTFAILVLLLYRQYGLQTMDSRTRIAMSGLDLGDSVPVVQESTEGRVSALVDLVVSPGVKVVLFGLSSCSICATLRPEIEDLPEHWPSVSFVWVDDHMPPGEGFRNNWSVFADADLHLHSHFHVSATPFAYVLRDGRIVGKDLVNRRETVESLLMEGVPK